MPDDRTVLDHLLEGRDSLLREVERLTAAIEQLDSVLGRIGSTSRGDAANTPPADEAGDGDTEPEPVVASAPEQVTTKTVNPPAEVEPVAAAPVPSTPRAPARKVAAKKAAPPRARRRSTEPPKSIRVHVLEMLQAENRDFGLAEIIDRVHGAGIQAHDDAVRSITIKLMKDGRVERVGRGQYRLARRGSARSTATVAPAAPAPVVDEPAPAQVEPAAENVAYGNTAAIADRAVVLDDPQVAAAEAQGPEPEQTVADEPAPEPAQDPDLAQDQERAPEYRGSYTPPLNLGQPWSN